MFMGNALRAVRRPPPHIRTGQPAAERYYGKPFFSWLSDHPAQASRYTAAMANLTGGFKTAAIAALPLDHTKTIVDVGGVGGDHAHRGLGPA